MPYPSFYSADGKALLPFYGTLTAYTVPATVVLDAEGRIAASVLGAPAVEADADRPRQRHRRRGHAAEDAPMSDWFTDQAASGSLALAVPVALLAGLVSFFSPCVIPLLPGYLSYATGLSGADLENARRGRMLAGALLFVLGFAVVFVAIGTAAGSMGAWLVDWKREITVVLGLVTIVLGLMFAGLLPGLQRDWRVHQVPAVGLAAAPLLGFLFGLGGARAWGRRSR